jgi:hypothetical protein
MKILSQSKGEFHKQDMIIHAFAKFVDGAAQRRRP